jgi:murein DD-endopeptidase MepM/ murein hydrolase activator NlpD
MANNKKDKDISIIIVPHGRGKVKIIKINKILYFLFLFLLISFSITLSYFVIDYAKLRESFNILTSKNLFNLSEVKDKQIELLEKKVNEQSAKLDAYIEYIAYLSSLETEIRKLAIIPGTPVNINQLIEEKKKEFNYTIEGIAAKVDENEKKIKSLETKSKNVELTLLVLRESTKEYNYILEHTPNIWPVVGPIMSDYGWRIHPVTKKPDFHKGVDIDAVEGTQIAAAASGVVTKVGWNGGYGIEIEIFHGNGISTVYAHCSKVLLNVGDEIKKGQVIALVGMTGIATDPHLHYEVRINGVPVDPKSYLPGLENK